jgi:hypothetical protein
VLFLFGGKTIMSVRDLKVYVSCHIIANIDDCLVIALCVDGEIACIVSGKLDELYEKLQQVFR